MKKIALFISIVGLIIGGCSMDDNCCMPNIMKASINALNLTGGYDGETFTLESPLSWCLINADNLPPWLKISDRDGVGNKTITVDVVPNEEGSRSFELIFMAANGDQIKIKVSQTAEYKGFLASDAPHWDDELNAVSANTFVTDKKGKILGSNKFTIGREESQKGSWFEYIEFVTVSVGMQAGWLSTAAQNSKPLYSFQILKVQNTGQGDVLWIVYRESENAPDHLVLQQAF